jgi:hypothetical protein
VEGQGLEVDILSRVACLHVDIPEASFTILSGDPLRDRAQSQDGGRLRDRGLVIGRMIERRSFVTVGDPKQRMPTRNVSI